jgi:hypothetical protein
MQQVPTGTVYMFEVVHGAEGLYRHEIKGYEPPCAAHDGQYDVIAQRIEVGERHGQYVALEPPIRAWHSAEAIHRYYRDRWS